MTVSQVMTGQWPRRKIIFSPFSRNLLHANEAAEKVKSVFMAIARNSRLFAGDIATTTQGNKIRTDHVNLGNQERAAFAFAHLKLLYAL